MVDIDQIPSETAAGRRRSQAELAMTEGEAEEKPREPAFAGAKGGKASTNKS